MEVKRGGRGVLDDKRSPAHAGLTFDPPPPPPHRLVAPIRSLAPPPISLSSSLGIIPRSCGGEEQQLLTRSPSRGERKEMGGKKGWKKQQGNGSFLLPSDFVPGEARMHHRAAFNSSLTLQSERGEMRKKR